MAWLPLYADEVDARDLLEYLNGDSAVAFVVPNGSGRWIARKALPTVPDGRYCLWHQPSGPLPLIRRFFLPAGKVRDPWAGWTESRAGADPSQPYFGVGHPGVIWWNLRTVSAEMPDGIGMSSFEWIGNHYRIIGSPAHPATEAWWKQLRAFVKSRKSKRVPRTGALDGEGAEIWAMPSALARLKVGVPRDSDPVWSRAPPGNGLERRD